MKYLPILLLTLASCSNKSTVKVNECYVHWELQDPKHTAYSKILAISPDKYEALVKYYDAPSQPTEESSALITTYLRTHILIECPKAAE